MIKRTPLPNFFITFKNAIQAFFDDDCYSRASALSYYTLLSIVPILAVAFGIAKGFGFEQGLKSQILETFYQQQDLAQKVIHFATSTLENAKGSLIAGVGVLALFWSALGLLGHLERSFNLIWKIPVGRPIARRITDYLPLLIFCPIFIIASSSLTFAITTKFVQLSVNQGVYSEVKLFIYLTYYSLLLGLTWFLFSFLYIYLPNKKVSWSSCIFAGLFAALGFQATQLSYIHFQIYLASYNAIYGSFAAIPLFMIWLQISWLITLGGAEIAAHHFASNKKTGEVILANFQELLALTLLTIQHGFQEQKPLHSREELASKIGVDVNTAAALIDFCLKEHLIMDARYPNGAHGWALAKEARTISFQGLANITNPSVEKIYSVAPSPLLEKIEKAFQDLQCTSNTSNLQSF